MSNRLEREAEDRYEAQNDPSPVSGRVSDNTYAHETRSGLRDYIPVQGDNQPFEDPIQPPYSNTDQQLAEDEEEAIDKSNILGGDRLRHAKPQSRTKYSEGPGENDIPEV
ncbi:hypothetical protein ATEIFO6365_0017001200 [Aspergillus terreus]|uniref:Uncharacterized protein n=1 Tax=Aspergillus terreus TaxID=33178 RepID=A0A5M3ZEB0_ASPTE|nr:hypothetical protein ATETN484_0018007600 [Aspergillus terreus]GFF21850.1 hypothetical protein ATEIFO6365_0017001200 [Aspergillus terreus]